MGRLEFYVASVYLGLDLFMYELLRVWRVFGVEHLLGHKRPGHCNQAVLYIKLITYTMNCFTFFFYVMS